MKIETRNGRMTPYYERDGITIFCGDCLEVMPRLKPGVDAIIADLPYGITACEWDEVIPFEPMWENYKRLIKSNGAVVLFGTQPFTSRLVMSNLEWFKYEWIWEKDCCGNPCLKSIQPLKYHENIIVFGETSPTYNPQMWEAGFRSNKTARGKKKSFVPGSKKREFNIALARQETDRYPKSVMKFNKPKHNNGALHPTQKPVALLRYLIRTYTNAGELVLDNVMGSGTTLVAAQTEGRRAIGIDISEEYCKIAVERLRQPSFFSIPQQTKTEKPHAKQETLL